jgi:hypothetical protein
MPQSGFSLIVKFYLDNHTWIMDYVNRLTDKQFCWKATPTTNSVAFTLWHLARWADNLQSYIPGATDELSHRLPASPQIWKTHKLAEQWGFPTEGMGFDDTGWGMDETLAGNLKFPAREVLLEYVQQSFGKIESTLKLLTDDDLASEERPQPGNEDSWKPGNLVARTIFVHIEHDMRHLGMIEFLVGLQSGHGSITG